MEDTSHCIFTRINYEELRGILVSSRCPPGEIKDSCSTYPLKKGDRDPCMDACDLVQDHGNGFSFANLMTLININEKRNFTSCFPSAKYGSGGNGIVLRVTCSENDTDFTHYAMKLTKHYTPHGETPYAFLNEVEMQKKFHRIGIAPKIITSSIYQKNQCPYTIEVIVMQPIDTTYDKIVGNADKIMGSSRSSGEEKTKQKRNRQKHSAEINSMVQTMKKHSLTHGDMHSQNIGFIGDKMVLIDFGRSTDFYPNTVLDLAAIAFTEVYMTSYLVTEIALKKRGELDKRYDSRFMGIMGDHVPCAFSTEPSVLIGKMLRYKFFMSQLQSHIEVLNGIYKSMKDKDDSNDSKGIESLNHTLKKRPREENSSDDSEIPIEDIFKVFGNP